MEVKQTRSFQRTVKKLNKKEKELLDIAVQRIIKEPTLGEIKKGDLAGVQVYKYKHASQQYLLAYQFVESELILTFIKLGTHENFYRDLKK